MCSPQLCDLTNTTHRSPRQLVRNGGLGFCVQLGPRGLDDCDALSFGPIQYKTTWASTQPLGMKTDISIHLGSKNLFIHFRSQVCVINFVSWSARVFLLMEQSSHPGDRTYRPSRLAPVPVTVSVHLHLQRSELAGNMVPQLPATRHFIQLAVSVDLLQKRKETAWKLSRTN